MNCSEFKNWLRDNPGQEPDGAIATHLKGCAACRELYREQASLAGLLQAVPQAELPQFYHARLAGRIARDQETRSSSGWRRAVMPLIPAAIAAVLLVTMLLIINNNTHEPIATPGPDSTVQHYARPAPQDNPDRPTPQNNAVAAAGPSEVYPVWPGNDDVVDQDDLSIMASAYPALDRQTTVKVMLDDQDVSGQTRVDQEYLCYSPKELAPGQHVVTITWRQADGGERSVTWSFYLMEAGT